MYDITPFMTKTPFVLYYIIDLYKHVISVGTIYAKPANNQHPLYKLQKNFFQAALRENSSHPISVLESQNTKKNTLSRKPFRIVFCNFNKGYDHC